MRLMAFLCTSPRRVSLEPQLQIFRSVVILYPVLVVYEFPRIKSAP
jgi:hypothetical protein